MIVLNDLISNFINNEWIESDKTVFYSPDFADGETIVAKFIPTISGTLTINVSGVKNQGGDSVSLIDDVTNEILAEKKLSQGDAVITYKVIPFRRVRIVANYHKVSGYGRSYLYITGEIVSKPQSGIKFVG